MAYQAAVVAKYLTGQYETVRQYLEYLKVKERYPGIDTRSAYTRGSEPADVKFLKKHASKIRKAYKRTPIFFRKAQVKRQAQRRRQAFKAKRRRRRAQRNWRSSRDDAD